jgi:amidase
VDQRGSGRIPAAWCGVVAIKPTHGLVPTWGIVYMDHSLDHVCPTAKTVGEVALALEVIAGPDRRDPQCVPGPVRVGQYVRDLERDVAGLRIGLLEEAFAWDAAEPDVNALAREGVRRLADAGATVEEVSIPLFLHGDAIWTGVVTHSMAAMVESEQEGYWRGGYFNVGWQEAFGKFRRAKANDFQLFTKTRLVLAKYLQREYLNVYYGKAQNLRLLLREQVDQALERVDLLAMPTTPQKPFRLMEPLDLRRLAAKTAAMTLNTSPFDLTGHPALTVPCGLSDGLPVGLQLVGRHWEDGTVLAAGEALERAPARHA